MSLAAAAVVGGAALKGIGMLDSYAQQKKAERDLAKLTSTPRARFGVSPQVRNLYEQAVTDATNPRGLGGAALSSYRSRLGQLMANKFRQATNIGGGARGVNAVLAGQEADALGNMYVQDESLRNSNRNMAIGRATQGANAYQRINDANTQQDISYRNLLEQSLGQSIRGQRDFRLGTLSGIGSDLITGGLMYGGGNNVGDLTEDVESFEPNITPSIMSEKARASLENPKAPNGFGGPRQLIPNRKRNLKMGGLDYYTTPLE